MTVTVDEDTSEESILIKGVSLGQSRKLTASGVAIKDDKHYQELKSRGLLNTDYALAKKLISEQILLGAAPLAAVLLQIAYPGIGKGVGLHSTFANRIIERAENTAMYMFTTLYGTPEEREKMRKFVTRRHASVNDRKTDNSYNALDPKLQLWVVATLYGTYVPAHEAVLGPMSQENREQALQEFSVLGTSLQVPLEIWPRNCEEFWKYWDNVVQNELEITEPCRKVTHELFHPVQNVPWSLKPLTFLLSPIRQAGAIEMLPEKTRAQYGLEVTWSTRVINTWTTALAKIVRPYQPEWFGALVANYYMDMVRKQIAERKIF
jgi:uncharacterized protein (DUF2236 family)